MIPLYFPALFGEYYQVLVQGQKAIACGIVVDTNDAARLFSIITRELMIPAEHWRGILLRLDVATPPNFYHAADIYQEVIKLFFASKNNVRKNFASGTIAGNRYRRWLGLLFYSRA